MKINDVLKNVNIKEIKNQKNIEVVGLTDKSNEVLPGYAFFCLKGINSDGHDFAKDAENKGASFIVCERIIDGIKIPQVVCEDAREAMAIISANFNGNPAEKLKMIAITGTNGKTTTSYLIKSILESSGKKVGLIGTTANYISDIMLPPKLTTPDPIDLHALLAKMLSAGCTHVVMEASAHALFLKKLSGITFDVSVFTNLTQDHLDFFGNMEKYGDAKKILFLPQNCKAAVINADDDFGQSIIKDGKTKIYTYGQGVLCDIRAVNTFSNVLGSNYNLRMFNTENKIHINLPGTFNIYNSLAAAGACAAIGILDKDIVNGLENVKRVEGRFNTIKAGNFNIVIDYAHTPDGVENILKTIKSLTQGRTISVFGCGGNRDKTKRPLMGKISDEIADYSIITSDNPRFENADDIVDEVEKGFTSSNYSKITDRRAAIRTAIDIAKPDDTIAILGKGAEDYQEINGIKHHFNDEEEATTYLQLKAKLNTKNSVVNEGLEAGSNGHTVPGIIEVNFSKTKKKIDEFKF